MFPFVIPWDDAAKTVTDVSFLNPAPLVEKHRIVVRDGHFRDTTGRRVRLLGVNFTFSANFPDKPDAEKVAARLHKYGINIVRLHHMDFFKAPNGIFDPKLAGLQQLDAEQLDRLDYLVAQLKRNGIYVDINLHVARAFTAADGFPDAERLPALGKVTGYFEPRMIELQKNYARDLLTHLNPYTSARYVDEPAVALIEINNEDSLLGEVWRGTLNELPDSYRSQLLTGWNSFLRKKYATTAALLTAWNNITPAPAGRLELKPGESLEAGNIPLPRPGATPPGEDLIAYLMELEQAYADGMRGYIKDTLHARALVTCSQASYGGLGGIQRESRMDYVDMHAYWQHPTFPGKPWDAKEWSIANVPMVSDPRGGTLPWLAMHRVEGKPFTVSEYNHPAPNDYSAETLPLLASYAAWQDWDGIFLFDYNGDRNAWNSNRIKGFFSSDSHPGKMALLPAAAGIFLRGYVGAVKARSDTLVVARGQVVPLTARYGNNAIALWEAQGITRPQMLGSHIAVRFIEGNVPPRLEHVAPGLAVHGLAPAGTKKTAPAPADPGHLNWSADSPNTALCSVVAPGAILASGFLGGRWTDIGFQSGRIADVGLFTVQMEPTPRNFLTLALTSADGRPLRTSRSMLLTAIGAVENTGMVWNEKRTSVGNQWGTGPTLVEVPPATLTLRIGAPKAGASKATVYILSPIGARIKSLPTQFKDSRLTFRIGPQDKTVWYEIAVDG